ncbi:glycosyltransferase family 4 protein [Streptomyces sp. Ncost-T10-10d]|uniref:glycosyltransferase family 4 protein n=1 Tax=Streptomyces sp. Ncost-T10-10d TaxID=1839774 RepID=UPI00081D6A95|nr:glycosyltransferase family 4 protein [Streptomyces sp. Ncost-T10-10d]SCF76493.1 glycogen(starch) synthase [Streptomyces sp. Ncost-T10-10d]
MNSHVLYLAHGSYRVRAAREHVKRLAKSGVRVLLVVPATEDWADAAAELDDLDNVEVVQLVPDKHGSVQKATKKLVLAKSGPAASIDTVIAGDAQCLPTAWTLKKLRPEVTLRLEPYDVQERAAGPADIAVITPWYPSPNNPYAGAFVKMATRSVAGRFDRVSILHTEDWSGRADAPLNDAIKITVDRLQDHRELVPVLDTPEGTLLRVPVPLIHRKNYSPWVTTQETALRKALPGGRIKAPVIHAHAGIYGGVLALRLAQPDARIVVTEHATFLKKVFAQPAARALYRDVLVRADAFLCVSKYLRDQIAAEFPDLADKLQVVPNVIDFDAFSPGCAYSQSLLKWLYVGRLVKHKGVNELLEAFALVAEKEPLATLTMVGSGALEEELLTHAQELGIADRFRILPPVAPDEVNGLMHQHDLLVHASKVETFGMTIVEAVAAGLPVLVTRSFGPEETLSGIESEAGALMEISDDPQIIADAYWNLRSRVAELDLPAAREELEQRYGAPAVAQQLMDVYLDRPSPSAAVDTPVSRSGKSVEAEGHDSAAPGTGSEGTATAPPAEPAGRAVLLALTPPKSRRIADFANHLLERGVHVTVVTANTSVWQRTGLDPRAVLVSIEKGEKKLRIPRGERFLVYRVPRAVLGRARSTARKRRGTITPELMVAATQRVHKKAANAFHKNVFNRGYQEVRPQLLSRIARREALPGLRLDLTDHVFVCDINSTVTGWKWAKSYPNLTVTTNLDRSLYSAKDA